MSKKIGELLVDANLIAVAQLEEAMKIQNQSGGLLGTILIDLNYVQERDVAQMLSRQFGVPAVNLAGFQVERRVLKVVPAEVARKYRVLPVSRHGATLTLAMADPRNVFAMDDIKFMTGYMVEPVVAAEITILRAIDHYYGAEQASKAAPAAEAPPDRLEMEVIGAAAKTGSDEAVEAVAAQVNNLLAEAIKLRASAIHLEPLESEVRVRFRIDGLLRERTATPLRQQDALIAQLKSLSQLKLGEQQWPQEGRIRTKVTCEGHVRELDFRVSVLPCLSGEKLVLRLQDADQRLLDLTRLGFEPASLRAFQEAIARPWGLVLVTGPAGSGKTTTLYSALERLNQPTANIMTAEDPVDRKLIGVNQVQVKDVIGFSYVAAVRSLLQQDPDVILVGELRNAETADVAVKAALGGHLVLSALHTNDAPTAAVQLLNMGIEPYLAASALVCAVAQRLVRRLCGQCRRRIELAEPTLRDLAISAEEAATATIYEGQGCALCHNSGNLGRIGLFEVMKVSDSLRELILARAHAGALRGQALAEGMITLRRSGIHKILSGICSVEEVCKETAL